MNIDFGLSIGKAKADSDLGPLLDQLNKVGVPEVWMTEIRERLEKFKEPSNDEEVRAVRQEVELRSQEDLKAEGLDEEKANKVFQSQKLFFEICDKARRKEAVDWKTVQTALRESGVSEDDIDTKVDFYRQLYETWRS
ncbi:MAG: hypothetical protein C4293_18130 [Nitrospiraceae bacterium]